MTRVDLGAMGGCDARTQGALNAVAFGATEDAAACPPSAARRLLLHFETTPRERGPCGDPSPEGTATYFVNALIVNLPERMYCPSVPFVHGSPWKAGVAMQPAAPRSW